jgi:sulfide:quinone oxidoreductase
VTQRASTIRKLATVPPAIAANKHHKIVVIGGGSAGIALSHQLLRKGKFAKDDVAVIDPGAFHHYQPGWTLVGGGLKDKKDLRRPMKELIAPSLKHYDKQVTAITPKDNSLLLEDGGKVNYDQLVVAPGIKVDYGSIKGLTESLANPQSPVASIYSYEHCDKAYRGLQRMKKGHAIFTQPSGLVKCAGAPQKIMWLVLDYWKRTGLYQSTRDQSPIDITFATGLPTMFGVPKYSVKLNELREQRGVEGLFQHNLVSVDGNVATFDVLGDGGGQVQRRFDFLHAVPRNVPYAFIKESGLGNEAGFVDVDQHSLRHKTYKNVWSIGDAAGLPTSKTVAAITSQAPILTYNILAGMHGKELLHSYDGYTSCPLLTGDKKVLLAEFKYGNEPKETFNKWLGIDQAVPRRAFYHLKKDFFPWVYDCFHVTGHWAGPKGYIR